MFDYLKENRERVLFCDRTGNLIRVYLQGDVSILFRFENVHKAQKEYTRFRRELEGITLGEGEI